MWRPGPYEQLQHSRSLRKQPRPCENSIGAQFVITVLSYVCMVRGLFQEIVEEIVVKFSREFGKRRIRDSKKAWFLAFWSTFRRRSIPAIVRTRVILYASAVKLNSARTFSKPRIRKAPWFIHCLMLPKGCSTSSRRC